jgi:hypothetical protein
MFFFRQAVGGLLGAGFIQLSKHLTAWRIQKNAQWNLLQKILQPVFISALCSSVAFGFSLLGPCELIPERAPYFEVERVVCVSVCVCVCVCVV